MTEQQFTNTVLGWAKVFGWRRFHVRNSGALGISQVQGDKGFPDLVLVRGTRLVVAELKAGKANTKRGQPRPEQQEWLNALAAAGAEAYTWTSDRWPQMLAVLSSPKSLVGAAAETPNSREI